MTATASPKPTASPLVLSPLEQSLQDWLDGKIPKTQHWRADYDSDGQASQQAYGLYGSDSQGGILLGVVPDQFGNAVMFIGFDGRQGNYYAPIRLGFNTEDYEPFISVLTKHASDQVFPDGCPIHSCAVRDLLEFRTTSRKFLEDAASGIYDLRLIAAYPGTRRAKDLDICRYTDKHARAYCSAVKSSHDAVTSLEAYDRAVHSSLILVPSSEIPEMPAFLNATAVDPATIPFVTQVTFLFCADDVATC